MPRTRASAASRSSSVALPRWTAFSRLLARAARTASHLGLAARHEGHVEARLGEDLDDPGRHGAGADDTDGADRPRARRGAVRSRGVSASSTTAELPGLGIRVEAATALAALQAGADHLLDDRARRVQAVAALLVHRVEDLVGRVEPDEVHQRERAHRIAAAELHRGVDVLTRRVLALEHRDGVVEVAEEQGVGDEAGLVADDDGFLPSRSASALTSSKISSLVMTVLMTSTNWSTGAGLKKCMPTTRLGLIVATAISVTGSELRVGREDRVVGDDRVELGEDVLLEVEVLGHGLDDELALLEVGHVARELDAGVEGGLVLGTQLAAGDGAVGGVLQDALALLDRLVGDLDRDDVDAVACEDLDDAGTHGAESDDADLGELTSHGRKSRRGCAPPTPARGVTLPTHLL